MDEDKHIDENGKPEDIYGDVPVDMWFVREQMNSKREERHENLPDV